MAAINIWLNSIRNHLKLKQWQTSGRQMGVSRKIALGLIIFLSLGLINTAAAQEKKVGKEIVIMVQHNIIALPDNIEIATVPLSAARVRSSELRELNKKYNAVNIERLYSIRVKEERGPGSRDAGPALASKEKPAPLKQQIDLTKVLTKETKKELERAGQLDAEGREIVQAEDTFLIQFESEKDININELVKAYKELPVVVDAQYVTRKK